MSKNKFEVGFLFGAKKNGTFDKTFSSINQSIKGVVKSVAALASTYAGISAFKSIATSAIESASSLEGYRSTLNVVMKDTKKAAETMKWAIDFANKTPFETDSIVEAAVRLQSYGLDATKVMTQIGDMAGVMNKDVMQAVEAVADAQTGELERMKEFGITKAMIQEKANAMFVGQEIINKKGQIVEQEKFNDALFALMEDRFKGGMEIQAESYKGILSTIQGIWKTGLASIAGISQTGEIIDGSAFDEIKGVLQKVSGSLQKFTDSGGFEKVGQKIGSWISKLKEFGKTARTITQNAANWFGNLASDSLTKILNLIKTNDHSFAVLGNTIQNTFENVKPALSWIIEEGLPKLIGFLIGTANLVIKIASGFIEHWSIIKPIVIGIGVAFSMWKVVDIIRNIKRAFIQLIGILKLVKAAIIDHYKPYVELPKKTAKVIKNTAAWASNKMQLIAIRVQLLAYKALQIADTIKQGTIALAKNTAAWVANKAQLVAIKIQLLAYKAIQIAGVIKQGTIALAKNTAAWVANNAQLIGNKVSMLALKGVQLLSTGATAALTAAQWALNAAFVASPIGWIVLGIGALIAAGVLLYKNWDKIKASALALWEGIKGAFSKVPGFFSEIWEGASNSFKSFINFFIKGINWIISGINKISITTPDWLPGDLGGKTMGFNIPEVPMLAKGGIATAPTLAMVGEGSEKEAILPLSKLRDLLGQFSGEKKESAFDKLLRVCRQPTANLTPAAASGPTQYVYSPVYHLHGSAGKAEVMEADAKNQQDFIAKINYDQELHQRTSFKPANKKSRGNGESEQKRG